MIFPDIDLDDWIKKYPALEVISRPCHYCKSSRVANIPFIEKDWVGLQSKDCSCGFGKGISISTPNPHSQFSKQFNRFIKNF